MVLLGLCIVLVVVVVDVKEVKLNNYFNFEFYELLVVFIVDEKLNNF